MQFKVVSALLFATLVAANVLPRDKIAPPFDVGTTISPTKCGKEKLQCCKFHFPKIIIVVLQ